jgi:hypothetical protein
MLINSQLSLADVDEELRIVPKLMQPKIHFGKVSFAGVPYYDPEKIPITVLYKIIKYHLKRI